MTHLVTFMAAPAAACAVLVALHAYLGVHVVGRGVIFVDIALAQLAALGAAAALATGRDIHSPLAVGLGLLLAAAGAVLFTVARRRRERVPLEAVIGVTYAIGSAAMILLLTRVPHGAEETQALLEGQILWISWRDVGITAAVYALLGLAHWRFRRAFFALSFGGGGEGLRRPRLWDFLFYMSLALMVNRSVPIAGVLLVFALLVGPAMTGFLLADSMKGRLAVSWTAGLLLSLAGCVISYTADLPTGPTIVCTLGAGLAAAAIARLFLGGGAGAR